tara:strand:- start:10 stop:255 length:246 start_codon:yes stop_codon:yes gene_type:complete
MREDVTYLIENTSSWKENFEQDTYLAKEVLPARDAVAKWKKEDPVMLALFKHLIVNHEANNQDEVAVANAAIHHLKESRNT